MKSSYFITVLVLVRASVAERVGTGIKWPIFLLLQKGRKAVCYGKTFLRCLPERRKYQGRKGIVYPHTIAVRLL